MKYESFKNAKYLLNFGEKRQHLVRVISLYFQLRSSDERLFKKCHVASGWMIKLLIKIKGDNY